MDKACCDFAFKMKLPGKLDEEMADEMRELAMENMVNCFSASMEQFNDSDLVNFFEACSSSGMYKCSRNVLVPK